jgi:hypothetical protein
MYEVLNLKILDYLGNVKLNRFVDNLTDSEYQVDLDISSFNEGAYLVKINNSHENVSLPIVIVK